MTRALLLALALCLPAYALAQDASPMGTATSADGSVISLFARPGPCVGNARLAEHKTRKGVVTPGCWLLVTNGVVIAFLDGEQGEIPAPLVVWVKSL